MAVIRRIPQKSKSNSTDIKAEVEKILWLSDIHFVLQKIHWVFLDVECIYFFQFCSVTWKKVLIWDKIHLGKLKIGRNLIFWEHFYF